MSDQQLASRLRHEVLPLGQRLFRIALSVTLNREVAEDIVQDVMLKLWERRDEWDGIASLEAWCTAATRNAAIDYTRLHREQSLPPLDDKRCEPLTPHDYLVADEGKHLLMKALDQLPEVQRAVFTLREAEGQSYSEIAAALSLTDSQVKTYLLRARRKLRSFWTGIQGV